MHSPIVGTTDVIVVGAGYTGLAVAKALQEDSRLSFRVLEATDRVGGRTLNVDVVTGRQSVISDDVIELGGEWLAKTQHPLALSLVEELGFELFHMPFQSQARVRTRATRPTDPLQLRAARTKLTDPSLCIVAHTSLGTITAVTPDAVQSQLPATVQAQAANGSAAFLELSADVPCGAPLSGLAGRAADYDGLSYLAWMQARGYAAEAQACMEYVADDAESVRAMSMLGVLWVYNCSKQSEGADWEDWWRIRGGSQGPALRLAQRLNGSITLNAPVRAVTQQPRRHRGCGAGGSGNGSGSDCDSHGSDASDDDVELVVETAAGETLRARHVVLAGLPPPLVAGLTFSPPLPADTYELLSRMPLGSSLKYSVVYSAPWWRGRGYRGNIETTSTAPGSGASPYVGYCLDNTPASGARGVLCCFVEGDNNRAFFEDLPSAAARRAHVLGFVGRSFNDTAAAATALSVIEHNWADQPYSRGAYMSYFPPGVITSLWPAWQRAAFEHNGSAAMRRLWIGGADYDTEAIGYIEGALRSGREVAEQILAAER